jgi:hypothetical protein
MNPPIATGGLYATRFFESAAEVLRVPAIVGEECGRRVDDTHRVIHEPALGMLKEGSSPDANAVFPAGSYPVHSQALTKVNERLMAESGISGFLRARSFHSQRQPAAMVNQRLRLDGRPVIT